MTKIYNLADSDRGFASMPSEEQEEIAKKDGRAAHSGGSQQGS